MEMMKKSGDIEAGNMLLLVAVQKEKLLSLRNLYLLLALQSLLVVAVGAVVVLVPAIPKFLLTTTPGIVVFIVALVAPFIVLFLLICYIRHRPVNYVLLKLYCVLSGFALGLLCSFSWGKSCLSGGILMIVVFITLTLYTCWAAARGHDFSFLGPFLMVSLFVLIVFALVQVFIPFGKLVVTISEPLLVIVFSGCIIHDSNNRIKRCNTSPQHCEPLPGMLVMSGGQ